MSTLVEILGKTERYLRERGVDSPRLDAELILAHILGLPRLQIYLQWDRPMVATELEAIRPLVARRGRREPLAWVLGEVGFHELDLESAPGVLVPRPDTETLVEAAAEWIDADADPVFVADVGTGTGAIALAIAHIRPGVRAYAIDPSPEALALARRNVQKTGLDQRVAVLAGRFLDPIPPHRPVDWVVSNPPYIPSAVIDGLEPEVARFEPRLALDGGPDGLDVYRELIPRAAGRARRGILLEVGHDQAAAVAELLAPHGFAEVRTWKDLGGIERVVGARRG